jgi:hypothetical protein
MHEEAAENPDDDAEWGQDQGFSPEYVRALLLSCVQAAIALVNKREDRPDNRAKHRIALMLKLMKSA